MVNVACSFKSIYFITDQSNYIKLENWICQVVWVMGDMSKLVVFVGVEMGRVRLIRNCFLSFSSELLSNNQCFQYDY